MACVLLFESLAPAPTAPPDAGAVRKVQRALQEVKKAPHAGISVLPDDEDAMVWHLIVDGPESTPYAGGTWRARFRFPGDFPRSPPECRFVTPIRHANINTSGRVCHSIFDRNLAFTDGDMACGAGHYAIPTGPGLGVAPNEAVFEYIRKATV